MCFFDQHRFNCGDWKWGHFRQHCNSEFGVGETCGMKLVMQTYEIDTKCKLCQKIDTKHRRMAEALARRQRSVPSSVVRIITRKLQYQPLCQQGRETRLFTLFPGDITDPVKGTLSIVSLDPLLLSKN